MKQRGFTLIEVFIAITFVSILILIGLGGYAGMQSSSNITYGALGMTESRCIEGYKFITDQNGNVRQILDELGKGVKCQKVGN